MHGKTYTSFMLNHPPKKRVIFENAMMNALRGIEAKKERVMDKFIDWLGPGWYGDAVSDDELGEFIAVDLLSKFSEVEANAIAEQAGYTNVRYAQKETDL